MHSEASLRLKNKGVLVIGGTGFIGSWLLRKLSSITSDLRSVSRRKPDEQTVRFVGDQVRFVIGDIAELDFGSIRKSDYVFYLARTITNTQSPTKEDFLKTRLGLENVLSAAKRWEAKFIFGSTGGVYGDQSTKCSEEQSIKPHSAYAKIFLDAERLADTEMGSRSLILRLFFPYGERQGEHQLIPRLILSSFKQRPVRIKGDVSDVRDFIYVRDVANIMVELAATDWPRDNNVIDVCTGEKVSIENLIGIIQEITGSKPIVELAEREPLYPPYLVGDGRLLAKMIAIRYTPLRIGLGRTVRFFRNSLRQHEAPRAEHKDWEDCSRLIYGTR